MAENSDLGISLVTPEMEMLSLNKESGYNYRERRQEDWLENYTLYRGIVTINRLTQRQSVHVPLMKQVIRTLLKDVDDMPVLYFENIDNDKQKEVFKNEYWKWTVQYNKMELNDIIDKKQVFLYGRSFDQWQIADGRVIQTIQDPQDILVSRYTDPTNLNTSRFLIHNHIYRSLTELESNPDYDQEAVSQLKSWYETEQGIVKVSENKNMATEKNRKMEDLGMSDVDSPVLGEVIFETSIHIVMRAENEGDEEEFWVYVEAEDRVILMKKRLEEIIGKTVDNYWRTHLPYTSWADDLERQDFWSDGVADIVRPGQKILDAWFSQLVENRTLRNFGMHYYDTTANEGNWSPNTYNPQPWGWYGVPGDPNKIVKKVDIPALTESLNEMEFVISMIESSSGATKTQQGNIAERNITLGEVQLALGEAKERIKGMSKFYTQAWKQRGEIFLKLIEAGSNKLDAVKLQTKGKNTSKLYEREVSPQDWMTKSGYLCKIWSQEEKESADLEKIQKLQATTQLIPGNTKLIEIQMRKLLEFTGLAPDEINAVMQEEKTKAENPQLNQLAVGGQDGQLPSLANPNPVNQNGLIQ